MNTDDDIPMQKKACHEFVKKHADWVIVNELSEKGVSGWTKKSDERDELVEIKQGALNNEFDVLLVFMFDRLGRREDETPLIVNFLNRNNVEVWSTQEGQRTTETHIDKLLNYISFWQSDGESLKTSIRTRESKKQLSEQGYFQGGAAPVGYKIIETDQVHWKNKDRRIKRLVPDDLEAEVVRLIYSLYIDRHMGYRKIADYLHLNGYRTREGKLYAINTIRRILENPIYVGRKRYNSFDGEMNEQPYDEMLRIVLDEQFEQAQEIRKVRRDKLKAQDKQGIPMSGKLLFSGLAYCKYCGAKLSGNYLYRESKRVNKEGYYKNIIYRYRCPLNKGKRHCNHEANIWGGKKYDKLILQQIKAVLNQLDISLFIDNSVKKKETKIHLKEKNLRNIEKEYQKLKKQWERLNAEIAKSLMGESDFSPQQLSVAIDDTNQKIAELEESMDDIKKDIEREKDNYSDVNFLANEIEKWEEKFDQSDGDLKKAMLSRVIDKVYFAKNEVEIEFNLMIQDILNQKG